MLMESKIKIGHNSILNVCQPNFESDHLLNKMALVQSQRNRIVNATFSNIKIALVLQSKGPWFKPGWALHLLIHLLGTLCNVWRKRNLTFSMFKKIENGLLTLRGNKNGTPLVLKGLTLIGTTYFLHRFSSFFSMAPLVFLATYFDFKGTQATAFLSSYWCLFAFLITELFWYQNFKY